MKKKENTNWTEYYMQKKSFFSKYTQQFTLEYIINWFDYAVPKEQKKSAICELGGGNSCFVDSFCEARSVCRYDVVDNNELAIQLFKKKAKKGNVHLNGMLMDLTIEVPKNEQYDFVYSIGLIEHFSDDLRRIVIKNHFSYCKENGYVLISFPTPTRKYRFWRKCMELFHMWQFWDEVPLKIEDVREDIEKYGEIKKTELNRKLFLTQMIVLVQKKGIENE